MNRDNLTKIIFPVTIFAGFLAGYWTSLYKLILRWNNGDDNYCYLIIPLFIYLCWEKRKDFRYHEFSWTLWGIVPAALSVGLTLMGERGSAETLVYLGLWGCIASIVFTIYGARTKRLLFPLLILAFMVPLPPFLNRMLTFKLKMIASTFAVDMLRFTGVSVVQEGNIIDLGIERLQVADACSGLRYFLPMILMGLLIGYFFSKDWWRKSILLVLVVPLAILINALRLFAAGMFTVGGNPELAHNLFHDFSGWLAFMAAGVILVGVAFFLNRLGPMPPRTPQQDPGASSAGILKPILLSILLCGLFLTGGLLSKGATASNTPPRQTFATFPMRIGPWEGKRSYLPEEILSSLWADDYVSATYQRDGSPETITLFIPFYAYQGTRHTAHAPQSCLLGGGWTLLSTYEYPIKVAKDKEIQVMLMTLEKGDQKLLGSYFFLQRGRVITSPWMNKFYLLWDSSIRKRTDGALVRVELLPADFQSLAQAQTELAAFISLLWPILPAYVPN